MATPLHRRELLVGLATTFTSATCRTMTTSASPSASAYLPPLRRRSCGPVELAYRAYEGAGRPVVFVHGSLDDHNGWLPLVMAMHHLLARRGLPRRPVLIYDRRGHGASTDVPGQGTIGGDVDDLATLLDADEPTHLVGHSYGANVAIELARRAPGRVASLFVYEPPLFGLLRDRPAFLAAARRAKAAMADALDALVAGDLELGVEMFVDQVAFGEGAWRSRITAETRARMLAHADTWLDQARDPERLSVGIDGLRRIDHRATLCTGTRSLETFGGVSTALEELVTGLHRASIDGARHDGPTTHALEVGNALTDHLARVERT